MRRNYSKDFDYHSQRNNAIVPYSSCNTTSMIMALKQAGWEMPAHEGQPEDALSLFLQTSEAIKMQEKLAPWSVGSYPPQQVHACLQWGVNKWMGEDLDEFSTVARAADLLAQLDSRGGVVLSGRFPLSDGELGHIVSLAGYVTLDASNEVIRWTIDDPYGNWHSQYEDSRGNDCDLTLQDFNRIFDRQNNGLYWAHMIKGASNG